MNPDLERFLNLRHHPATVPAEIAAGMLGIAPHELTILVAKGLVKPLGHPAPNAPKHFLTAAIKDLDRDAKWHGKARDALQEYWRLKNARKQDAPAERPSSRLQAQSADLGD
jgi:hypothetical protein